jgi:hypothetical protein
MSFGNFGNNDRLRALSNIAKISKTHKLNIKLLTKIPKEFWDRNKSVEINCAQERKKNPDIRTQICLGNKDIELMTKHKNDLYWQSTPLSAFGPIEPPSISTITASVTPEGRLPKRGPSSPLNADTSKHHKGSNSPEPTS